MRTLKMGMKGNDIMEIQALFKKLGCKVGKLDGVYGLKTFCAVLQFQFKFGLNKDGILGPETYNVLEPFLLGFDSYTITLNESLNDIASKFFTKPEFIKAANNNFNFTHLKKGQQIIVPYGLDIVDTNINYTYEILKRDITGLKKCYPFIEVGVAGKSVLGRDILYIRLGTGPNEVFYNGVHHGLEWITAPLLMKFAEDFLRAYVNKMPLGSYNPRDIWKNSSIYIIPMVNPDGAELVLSGLTQDNPNYNNLLTWNNGSTNFSTCWQANNNGVDLNHNYNAMWNFSKDAEKEYGINGPGPTRFSGPYPHSEPETKSIVEFTKCHDFRLVLAFHSQGEVIYLNFMDLESTEARILGEKLSCLSGYKLEQTEGIASYSGYKDWFIQEYRRPGFTIEVGLGTNPLPISQFNTIYNKNLPMLLYCATY